MRRVTTAVLLSALIFGILSTWVGPKAISYWYRPPVPSGAASAFNCVDAVDWAMGRLVWTQIWGTVGGALIGLVVGLALGRRKPPPSTLTEPSKTATPPAKV